MKNGTVAVVLEDRELLVLVETLEYLKLETAVEKGNVSLQSAALVETVRLWGGTQDLHLVLCLWVFRL